jgi:hypothetical protein
VQAGAISTFRNLNRPDAIGDNLSQQHDASLGVNDELGEAVAGDICDNFNIPSSGTMENIR